MQVRAVGTDDGYRLIDKETGREANARRRENGKFDITINGNEFYNNSLRDCKELLTASDSEDTGEERPGPGNRGAWDCVHPCAWLIELLAISEDRIKGSPDFQELWPEIIETLDCYGYITPEGGIDSDAARWEIDHWLPKRDNKLPADQPATGD